MKDEYSIFSRSFSQHDQKKLGFGALLSFFITAFTICTVFKLPALNLEGSMASGLKMLMCSGMLGKQPKLYSAEVESTIHDFSNNKSDVYEINGDIRIHGISATVFVGSSTNTSSWTIKPYARKLENVKIEPVREWKITNQVTSDLPDCSRRSNVPAVLFSTGAYSGNHFHSFTDILIPLYLTTHQLNGTVVFLITDDIHSWWRSKFQTITGKLSKYDIVNIDKETETLCFSRVFVGLKGHKEFGIDPLIPPHYSMKDFRQFLRSTYSLERGTVTDCRRSTTNKRPRMLIVSRVRRRRLRNEGEVAIMARELGFETVVSEIGPNLTSVAKFVNSFDVMVGVHGAGLTNMVFLPENAIVIEIVPIAVYELSYYYFELPIKGMDLRYLEYRVTPNESSLSEYYSPDSRILRGPHDIHSMGWLLYQSIFLTMQDVTLDLGRFKSTASHALELLCS